MRRANSRTPASCSGPKRKSPSPSPAAGCRTTWYGSTPDTSPRTPTPRACAASSTTTCTRGSRPTRRPSRAPSPVTRCPPTPDGPPRPSSSRTVRRPSTGTWPSAPPWRAPSPPRPPSAAGAGEAVEWRLDAVEAGELAAAAALAGTTVFEFLLAALHGLLRRYGGEAVPVSVPLSTRTAELHDEIGMFVNELPVHAPAADPSQTFTGFAAAVRAELRAGYPYRSVPFGAAVSGLGPRVGLTPVSLGYRRRGPDPEFADSGARISWAVYNRTARNTLHLQIVEAPEAPPAPGGGLDFSLQYDPAVLAPDAARRIAGHYRTLLAGAIASPGARLLDLPLRRHRRQPRPHRPAHRRGARGRRRHPRPA
ncbi:condensation domain-containing protein, partial [Streptomyces massasporeus]